MKIRPGATLGEHYQIDRVLGRGAVGHVFLAQDMALNRPVAIKVLKPHLSQRLETDERFRREARLLSRLNHPNVVVIHAFGKTDTGAHYIVMEYISGMGLDEHIVHHRYMAPDTLCHVFDQIAAAMGEAHRHGIVHRDLKPENILLCQVGGDEKFVKVVDFGLAKVFEQDPDDEDAREVTQRKILGSPPFMAPEQIRIEEVDARTDIYALGVLASLLLTGRLPYKATLPQEFFMAHLKHAPTPPSELRPELEITPELDAVILRALAKEPDKRFDSAPELARALKRAIHAWQPEAFGADELSTSGVSSGVLHIDAEPQDPLTRVLMGLEPRTDEAREAFEARHLARVCTVLHLEVESSGDALAIDEHVECLSILADKVEQVAQSFKAVALDRFSDGQRLLFGVTGEDDRQAEFAVDAGIALRAALRGLRSDPTLPSRFRFRFRIGVDTGRMLFVLTEGGRSFAHGVVLRNARGLATEGTEDAVRLSPGMFRRVRQLYDGQVQGGGVEVQTKRSLAFSMRPHQIHGVDVELHGRDEEINLLRGMLAEAIRGHHTLTALIQGTRGIGKSRLLQHFVLQILELPDFYRVYHARCDPALEHPYGPFVQALRGAIRLDDGDSEVVAKLKIQQFFRRRLASDATELSAQEEGLLRDLQHLLGFSSREARPADDEDLGRRPVVITRLLQQMATQQPSVLVIEDLQWASAETLQILRSLTGSESEKGMLLVLAARTEPGERVVLFEEAVAPKAFFPFVLEKLPPRTVRAMIRHMLRKLEDIPDSLVQQIAELADGVPLIAEEIIRDLIDQETLAIDPNGSWHVHPGRLGDRLVLPESVEQLFLLRIERLSESLRAALEVAAVAGDRFWPSMVADLLEEEAGERPQHRPLRELARRGLVMERRDSVMRGEEGYSFGQVAVREAVYRMIPRARRSALHRDVARWLERNTRGQIAGYEVSLGKHFFRAGDLERAFLYLRRAASRAAASLLVEEAIAYNEMCLELVQRLPKRGEDERMRIEEELVQQLTSIGRHARAVEIADRLLARAAVTRASPERRAHIALYKGIAHERLGQSEEAVDAFQLAGELGSQASTPLPVVLQASTRAAVVELSRGGSSIERAVEMLEPLTQSHVERASDDLGWCQSLAESLRVLGDAHLALGHEEKAARAYRRGYELALTGESPSIAVESLLGLGMLRMRQGDGNRAEDVLKEALESATQAHLPYHRAAAQARLGEVMLSRAEWADAVEQLRPADEFYELSGDMESRHRVLCMLGSAYVGTGALDAALEQGRLALERVGQTRSPSDAVGLTLALFERLMSHLYTTGDARPMGLDEVLGSLEEASHIHEQLKARAQHLLAMTPGSP